MKSSSFRSLYLVGGLASLLLACNRESRSPVERPTEAWVVRSVLDTRPRMLSIALHDTLYVAYNTQTASLYKAWEGGINFDGPVYTSAHGPQPTSTGTPYLVEPDLNPWRIIANGTPVEPEVVYKGHIIRDNRVTLQYQLVHNGQAISVTETPEYAEGDGKQVLLERTFVTSEVPANTQVALTLMAGPQYPAERFETDGTLEMENGATTATLLLNNNGKSVLRQKLVAQPVVAGTEKALAGEDAVLAIMARSDCNTCHNRDVKTVGPAYIDIAKRYPNNAQVTGQLVNKVIEGGAGNWGEIPMTPHPNLAKEDAATMVSYILALDAGEEAAAAASKLMPTPPFEIKFQQLSPEQVDLEEEKPGIAMSAYQFGEAVNGFPEINDEMLPIASGEVNAIHFNEDFGGLNENFALHATGYINLKKTTNVVFRLVSDDGSRFFINNEEVVDNGGNHGMEARDGEMNLKAGKHPFRLEYFQGGGGKGLSLQWRPYGSKEFSVVPPEVFTYRGAAIKKTQQAPLTASRKDEVPGDGFPLRDVHPSFTLTQARPDGFRPKVGGMDFLSDGRLVLSTWDSLGSVFILDGVQGQNPEDIKVKRIAFGLAEPLGLKVVDDEIYVLQKQELTKLVEKSRPIRRRLS